MNNFFLQQFYTHRFVGGESGIIFDRCHYYTMGQQCTSPMREVEAASVAPVKEVLVPVASMISQTVSKMQLKKTLTLQEQQLLPFCC